MQSHLRTLVCLTFFLVQHALFAAPELVGELGDLTRLKIDGNSTFDSASICRALGRNAEIILGGHPQESLQEFSAIIERQIRDGYQQSGFPDVKVKVIFDSKEAGLIATVHEGKRYRSGTIELTGAKTIDAEAFCSLLGERKDEGLPNISKSTAPVWQQGRPASFATGYWESQRENIQKAFQSLGYLDVSYSSRIRPNSDGTATLIIAIQDEGPRAILGDIEVTGTQKNSPDEVIKYLNLTPGTLLSRETKSQVEKDLSNSARFLKHTVEVITPPFGDAASTLKISLVEFPDAPKLTDSLSPAEAAMVRLAHWIDQVDLTDVDTELWALISQNKDGQQFSDKLEGEIRFVASPTHQSFLGHVALKLEGSDFVNVWLHASPEFLVLDAPDRATRFEARGISLAFDGRVRWTSMPPDAQGRMAQFFFGLNWKSNTDRTLPPFKLTTTVDPVVLMREAHLHRDSLKIDDDVLSIIDDQHHLVIDSQTGRLKDFNVDYGGDRLGAGCQSGRYEELLKDCQKQAENNRVISSGDYPISNLLAFLATSLPEGKLGVDKQNKVVVDVAHALLKRGALHPFDELARDFFAHSTDRFELPPPASIAKMGPAPNWTIFVVPFAHELFPKASWPLQISREFAYLQTRHTLLAQHAIGRMLSNESSGPLENLVCSWVFGRFHPGLRLEFARHGLDRLQRLPFRKDIDPLLAGDSGISKLLLAMTQTLQDVDDREIAAMVEFIPLDDRDRQSLTRALRLIPANRGSSPAEALQMALDDAWEPLIEPHLRLLLQSQARPLP